MSIQKQFTKNILLLAASFAMLVCTACGNREKANPGEAPKDVQTEDANQDADTSVGLALDDAELQEQQAAAELLKHEVDTAEDSKCLHLPATEANHVRAALSIPQDLMSPVETPVGNGYGRRCLYNKKDHPGLISIFINRQSSAENFATVKKEVVGGELVDTKDPAFDDVFFQEMTMGPYYAVAVYARTGSNQVIVQSGTNRDQVLALAAEIMSNLSKQ